MDAGYSHIEPIAKVVRRAMLPKPKHGKKGEIHRVSMLERLTLDEFTEWCGGVLATIPEFKRRLRIKGMVTRISAAKPVLAETDRSQNKKLQITL